jgi:transposase-like protein
MTLPAMPSGATAPAASPVDVVVLAAGKGTRTEQALNIALAEMYVQGVSTRKVADILVKLLGPEVSVSSTQVSRAAEQLDAGLAAWRERPLDETPYLFLDARYERVREAGRLVDCAVLVAVGITADGKRRVLGVSVALSEAEVHWRAFLDSLIRRELKRRTRVASIFPNTASCLRLVPALLAECDEEWMVGKIYLNLQP